MALSGGVEDEGLAGVDGLEQLRRVSLFLEVDQLLIVLEYAHVGERTPSSLDLLHRHHFTGLLRYLSLSLEVSAPSPLDLDGRDVIHGKAMILEETSRQCHLVRCLNQSSTEVPPTLLL